MSGRSNTVPNLQRGEIFHDSLFECLPFWLKIYLLKKTASTRNIKLSLKDFKNSNMLRGLDLPPTPMWESDYDIIVSKGAHGTQCLELKEILKFQLARY